MVHLDPAISSRAMQQNDQWQSALAGRRGEVIAGPLPACEGEFELVRFVLCQDGERKQQSREHKCTAKQALHAVLRRSVSISRLAVAGGRRAPGVCWRKR